MIHISLFYTLKMPCLNDYARIAFGRVTSKVLFTSSVNEMNCDQRSSDSAEHEVKCEQFVSFNKWHNLNSEKRAHRC